MKVYFTGMPLPAGEYMRLMKGRPVMYSFLYRHRSVWCDPAHFSSLALDSGAWSVWRGGAHVDIGEYADYCARVEGQVAWYANLDVIGDWRLGLSNLAFLEARGLSPMPVFHAGEPWGLLDDLCLGYERVGLARGPGISRARMWRMLDEVFRRYCDADGVPLVKFHGFRMTDRQIMARFPFDSVDSTTWIAGSAWDTLPTDAGRARGFSFLSGAQKADAWLSFFDCTPKAHQFAPFHGGLDKISKAAPVRSAYVS